MTLADAEMEQSQVSQRNLLLPFFSSFKPLLEIVTRKLICIKLQGCISKPKVLT